MFEYFYHQRIKKSVAVFGTIFNDIYVVRKNSSGNVLSQVKVPLAYAPREKYLERIRTNPDLRNDSTVALKLPRMSFEITSFQYDTTRKLPKLNNFNRDLPTDIDKRYKIYQPVPYLISFQLNVYAKNQDDALQIVEQILPYFNPQYSVTIKPVEEDPTIKEDVPITIQSVSFSDDFEGSLENRRTIIYTLDFIMTTNFYGPLYKSNIIRKATTDVHQLVNQSENDPLFQRHTTTINPENARPTDNFGFTTVIDEDFAEYGPDARYVEDGYIVIENGESYIETDGE